MYLSPCLDPCLCIYFLPSTYFFASLGYVLGMSFPPRPLFFNCPPPCFIYFFAPHPYFFACPLYFYMSLLSYFFPSHDRCFNQFILPFNIFIYILSPNVQYNLMFLYCMLIIEIKVISILIKTSSITFNTFIFNISPTTVITAI